MTINPTAPTATQHWQVEHVLTRHPQREVCATEAVLGVLEYCQKLEDHGVQRIVTQNLRKIVHNSFGIQKTSSLTKEFNSCRC